MNTYNKKYGSLFWGVALLIYSALIFYLSSQSYLNVPIPEFKFQDKLFHATAYSLLALLAWLAFARLSKPLIWAWIYAVMYGASDEWHQSFVPNRFADIWDWLADITGATIAIIILYYMHNTRVRGFGQLPKNVNLKP
jgi:VanZ family protein